MKNVLKEIRHELNYLTKEDLIGIVPFIASLIPAALNGLYLRFSKKKIWLISEDKNEGRDNGICFFQYLNSIPCEAEVYYAISNKSADYKNVASIGKTVKFGSIKHWILYFNCEYNISTQKASKPNAAIGYVLEQLAIIKGKSIFLQHGITLSNAKWLYYKNTKMRLFICGAKPEYNYVKNTFGYPENHVAYLGFCRFDSYHKPHVVNRQILLIPSWREWIGSKNEFSSVYEDNSSFENTEYFKKYQSLINNDKLINLLSENGIILFFYPHRNMQKFVNSFSTKSNKIIIVDNKNSNIRQLLLESALMITDYSSVGLDFAYMKKPVVYYQFDIKRFREAQYEAGYFDYESSGLGVCVKDEEELVNEIEKAVQTNFVINTGFETAHGQFFPLYDDKNCERTYKRILDLRNE